MKYFIVAGEASGDIHGSDLMESLKSLDPQAEFAFWGGDKMAKIGGTPLKHIKDLAFMGFYEVLINIRTILSFFKDCKRQISEYQPDAIIFIDYPGFNLRMSEWAKKKNFKVFFYISPTVWAWKENRVEKIKKYIDRLFVILPFEKPFYAERNVDVSYYGHPLLEVIEDYRQKNPQERKVIGLFPGSRKQEINKLLPLMIESVKSLDEHALISKAPSIPTEFYQTYIGDDPHVSLFEGNSYELFNQCRAALVTSGTATLECALFEVPQVVCYKTSGLSYSIAKRLVKVEYAALINLILNREAVKELIQNDCTSESMTTELNKLFETPIRDKMLSEYQELKKALRTDNELTVSQSIAEEIIDRLNN